MGGVHPTLFPAHVLRNRNVDYCVRGEGETPFLRLVSSLSQGRKAGEAEGIPGVCFRRGEGIHLSKVNVEEDIDLLPNREILEGIATGSAGSVMPFFSLREAAPFVRLLREAARPVQEEALASIEEEMAQCARLGVEAIDFEDDMLNLDKGCFCRSARPIQRQRLHAVRHERHLSRKHGCAYPAAHAGRRFSPPQFLSRGHVGIGSGSKKGARSPPSVAPPFS